MPQPAILVVGDWNRSEFSAIHRWVDSLGPRAGVRQIADLSIPVIEPPDLVIVCQSWPDEFPMAEVTTALGRWPLAIWICCYGAWCASDGRTRSIWPISVRVPVDEAECRLNHVWRVLTEQRGEPLPLTASRDEAFEFDHCVDRSLTSPVARP